MATKKQVEAVRKEVGKLIKQGKLVRIDGKIYSTAPKGSC